MAGDQCCISKILFAIIFMPSFSFRAKTYTALAYAQILTSDKFSSVHQSFASVYKSICRLKKSTDSDCCKHILDTPKGTTSLI